MSEDLGPMVYGQKEELIFLGREISEQRDYSENVAEKIDKEVRSIVNDAYREAKQILTDYREKLDDMPARIDATIRGIPDPSAPLADIRWQYENFLPWLEQPGVLCLRFEDLILARTAAFNRLLDYLAQRGYTPQIERAQALAALERAIDPKKSGTFRKAQPGNWQQHFTEANNAALKEVAGDILIRLGYEQDNDW